MLILTMYNDTIGPMEAGRRRARLGEGVGAHAYRMTGARGIGSGFGPVSIDAFSLGGGEVVEKGGDDGLGDVFVDGDALLAELERTVLDDAEGLRRREGDGGPVEEEIGSVGVFLEVVLGDGEDVDATDLDAQAADVYDDWRSVFGVFGEEFLRLSWIHQRDGVLGRRTEQVVCEIQPIAASNRPRSDEHDASGAFDARLLLLVRRHVVDVTRAALLKRRLNLRARAHEMHAKRTLSLIHI